MTDIVDQILDREIKSNHLQEYFYLSDELKKDPRVIGKIIDPRSLQVVKIIKSKS